MGRGWAIGWESGQVTGWVSRWACRPTASAVRGPHICGHDPCACSCDPSPPYPRMPSVSHWTCQQLIHACLAPCHKLPLESLPHPSGAFAPLAPMHAMRPCPTSPVHGCPTHHGPHTMGGLRAVGAHRDSMGSCGVSCGRRSVHGGAGMCMGIGKCVGHVGVDRVGLDA